LTARPALTRPGQIDGDHEIRSLLDRGLDARDLEAADPLDRYTGARGTREGDRNMQGIGPRDDHRR